MQERADEIILRHQVALVDRRHVGQLVHIVEDGAVAITDGLAATLPGDAVSVGERPAIGDFLDGEVELAAGDKVDGVGRKGRCFGRDGHMRTDKPDQQGRVLAFQRFGDLHVGMEGRRAGVQHQQLILARQWADIVERQAARGCIDEAAAGHQGCGLRQPCWIPEGADLALGLIARAGAAIEAVEEGGFRNKVFMTTPPAI